MYGVNVKFGTTNFRKTTMAPKKGKKKNICRNCAKVFFFARFTLDPCCIFRIRKTVLIWFSLVRAQIFSAIFICNPKHTYIKRAQKSGAWQKWKIGAQNHFLPIYCQFFSNCQENINEFKHEWPTVESVKCAKGRKIANPEIIVP